MSKKILNDGKLKEKLTLNNYTLKEVLEIIDITVGIMREREKRQVKGLKDEICFYYDNYEEILDKIDEAFPKDKNEN